MSTFSSHVDSRSSVTFTSRLAALASMSIAVAGAPSLAGAQTTQFFGPTPYLQPSDSPFASMTCSDYVLEDFENGGFSGSGVHPSAGSVHPPNPFTDSVDADAGGIDGTGSDGHSWWSGFPNGPKTMKFTFTGALPTLAGLVWTDCFDPAVDLVTFEAFDANNLSLGTVGPVMLGNGVATGETAEDRFFGVQHTGGIRAISVTMSTNGNFEIDHVQYGCATKFFGPTPYLQLSDSPLLPIACPDFYVEDFESGTFSAPGVTPSAGLVQFPGAFTDSVDADAGGVDGTGVDGHSWWSGFPNGPKTMKFTFTGALPTIAGLVWTDCFDPAVDLVTFEAFGANNVSLGIVGPATLGNGVATGETVEDSFFGVLHTAGIKAISITMATNGNFEIDHLQFGCRLEHAIVTPFCFCEDHAACGNNDPTAGCRNTTGVGSLLQASGSSDVSLQNLQFSMSSLPPNQAAILAMGKLAFDYVPFQDGKRCIFPVPQSHGLPATFAVVSRKPGNSSGTINFGSMNAGTWGLISPGDTWHFQGFYRDQPSVCGGSSPAWNSSNALSVLFY